MTNLDFLKEGQIFPPLEEAKRIGACAEYDLMYDGDSYAVEEKHFKQTLKNLNRLAMLLGWSDSYVAVEYNYFQLCSLKTADFVCGEIPDITSNVKDEKLKVSQQEVIEDIRKNTSFDIKHYDGWVDVSKYGESYFRVYARDGRNTFTLQSPAMLFRIKDEEDDYEVKNYVVAWLTHNDTVLKVQIHSKGSFVNVEFRIRPTISDDLSGQTRYTIAKDNNVKSDLFALLYDRYTDEVFRCRAFKIVEEISRSEPINTGLDDFAIIPLFNVMNSSRTYGMSDYDRFDSIVTQIQRSMTEVQLIFDKYTTPSMGVPIEALTACEETGENIMEIGKAIGIPSDGIMPAFIEPDLSKLEMYFRQIEMNVTRIKELSEMGAALTADTTVSNISTETMKATFSSALKKAERLTTRNTNAIKKLFHLISMYGYGEPIQEDNISITWYDGLPNDEEKDARVATMKVQSGFSNRKEEYTNRFNHTQDEFDVMWEQYLQEQSDLNTVTSVGNTFNPFNSKSDDNAIDIEQDEKKNENVSGVNSEQGTPSDGDNEATGTE